MPIIRPRVRFLLLALALAGCSGDSPFVCNCVGPAEVAILYGRVTDAAGAPAAGARVRAEATFPGCTQMVEEIASVESGADGRYRTHLAVHLDSPDAERCLRTFATPSAAQTTLRTSDTVTFEVDLHRTAPFDSVRVDLVLRAP